MGDKRLAVLESLAYLAHGTNHLAVDELLGGNVLGNSVAGGGGSLVGLAVEDGLKEAVGGQSDGWGGWFF